MLASHVASTFRHHIAVKMLVSPPPTTAKEARHLLENFRTIGNVELFRFEREKSGCAVYGQELLLLYNPSNGLSPFGSALLDSSGDMSKEVESQETVVSNQKRILDDLQNIVALPRYSYIEHDEKYMNGQIEIPFKHRLVKEGLQYDKRYTIPSSTIDSQFSRIIPVEDSNSGDTVLDSNSYGAIRSYIRHNFQKFHKFDSISIRTSPTSIGKWITPKIHTNPHRKINFSGFEM
ncbi:uncharacterized protein RJT20DRAFT_128427 [Scheffersomyces xylosifermentans]|uniref:uncharacterized protein n=1 Tax=Scheffersomyces xylosifermentans TaxID=1304137 RepID=UPI00315D46F3